MAWLIVAGDFTPLGGMDAANHALARYLASRDEIHLVTHRAWPDIEALPTVTVHRVWRPWNRHLLGSPLLSRTGRRVWRRLRGSGVHVVVNGGNCPLAGVNWVHYVHAAYSASAAGSLGRRTKSAFTYTRDLAAERLALRDARLIVCNSRRTRDDVVARLGIDPSRTRVVYYGSDPVRFALATGAERAEARRALACRADRPLLGFVGALGDRRKAFDSLFEAWRALCKRPEWDADLVVVGTGAERALWEQRAREGGMGDRMRFLGFRDDVPAVLAALDGVVHPARYEAYGLAVHEALCRGVPALVSATAGVAEHYPPALADLLIGNPDDREEIRTRLQMWRRDLERWRAAVVPVSASLRARTWDAMAAEMADCARLAS